MTDAHMEAFSEQQRERFEDEMFVHLTQSFPEQVEKSSEQFIRELIREGIKKASSYDITLERDVARYIEFMIAIAPDFDDSPDTPWAKKVLTGPMMTAEDKLDRIEQEAFGGGW